MFAHKREGVNSAGEEGVFSDSVEIEIDGEQMNYSISATHISCSAPSMIYSPVFETDASLSSDYTPPQPYSHHDSHKIRNKAQSSALRPPIISSVLSGKASIKKPLTLKQSSTSNEMVSFGIQKKHSKKSRNHNSPMLNSMIDEKRNISMIEYNMEEDVLVCLSDAGIDSDEWQAHAYFLELNNHVHI